MTFGSLFAGIGGFDLGLERAGMVCKWQVEIDPFCRRVLAKHWPDVRRHDDVRTFPPGDPDEWRVDLISGGFPCQDLSLAGKGAGLDGDRSGLWSEYARVVRLLRPRYVLVENVPGLLARGLDRVLGTLVEIGYDAEWTCLPAASVGAPHIRERVFILAHSQRGGGDRIHERQQAGRLEAHPEFRGLDVPRGATPTDPTVDDVAHPHGSRLEIRSCFGQDARAELAAFERGCSEGDGVWATEPDVGRVAHGVPARVDRLRGLGNAVVPDIAQWIGGRILRDY